MFVVFFLLLCQPVHDCVENLTTTKWSQTQPFHSEAFLLSKSHNTVSCPWHCVCWFSQSQPEIEYSLPELQAPRSNVVDKPWPQVNSHTLRPHTGKSDRFHPRWLLTAFLFPLKAHLSGAKDQSLSFDCHLRHILCSAAVVCPELEGHKINVRMLKVLPLHPSRWEVTWGEECGKTWGERKACQPTCRGSSCWARLPGLHVKVGVRGAFINPAVAVW